MNLPIGDRVAFWSDLFLKQSSEITRRISSTGVAPSIRDSAPLLPPHYDCTTFVETIAALSLSKEIGEFYPRLLSIRYYDGKFDFIHRNHFPEADWIPNNTRSGILTDITEAVARSAGVFAGTEVKMIGRGKWLSQQVQQGKVSRSIASESDEAFHAPPVQAKVAYVPVEEIDKVSAKIPNGTVLNLVRGNNPHQPVLITHQGFVVQKEGVTYLRHATPDGNIRTVELSKYLHAQFGKDRKGWPVIGVNLNQLNDRS